MRPGLSLVLPLVLAFLLPATATAQEELARGYRCIRQEGEFAQIGVGLVGETVGPETVFERLPVDVMVLEFRAFRIVGTDPPEFGEIPVDVLPPIIEGDELVQEIHLLEPGVIVYVYSLDRALLPHETTSPSLRRATVWASPAAISEYDAPGGDGRTLH